MPADPGLEKEIMALRHFNGQGCVQLLNIDQHTGVMLLEMADPGLILESLNDEQQACIRAVKLMQQLHKPVNAENNFDTLQNWFTGLNSLRQHANTELVSQGLIDKAQKLSLKSGN